MNKEVVEDFISHFKGSEDVFLNGCCYWFAHILFCCFNGEGRIVYSPILNHFAWLCDSYLYDASGGSLYADRINENWVPWEWYYHNFPYESARIVRECIWKIE